MVETGTDAILGPWDQEELRRALENVIDNAVKYSPRGGAVTVRVWTETDTALVSVTDQGIGIPAADLPNVFARFHRGANVSEGFTGSGIGLASAQRIVRRLDGSISVESREGSGSVFTVCLPLGNTGS